MSTRKDRSDNDNVQPKVPQTEATFPAANRSPFKPSLEILEPRILMSATWAEGSDADHGDHGHGHNQVDGGMDNGLSPGQADHLPVTNDHEVLQGNNGDDILGGGAGHETTTGSGETEALTGGASNDHLAGNNGKDTLTGGAGNDTIDGGNGQDTLEGGNGNDTLTGGNGKDTLDAGGGHDTMVGGNGKDTFIFNDAHNGDVYTVDGGKGQDTIDLSTYSKDQVHMSEGRIDVTMDNGGEFTIFHSNVEEILTGEANTDHLSGGEVSPPSGGEEVDPVSTEPVGSDHLPTDPVGSDHLPVDPVSTEPAGSDHLPTDPVGSDHLPTEPVGSDHLPTDPVGSNHLPTEPVGSDHLPVDPVSTEPTIPDHLPTDPVTTEPIGSGPVPIEPAGLEHGSTEPVTTEIGVTEPVHTEVPMDHSVPEGNTGMETTIQTHHTPEEALWNGTEDLQVLHSSVDGISHAADYEPTLIKLSDNNVPAVSAPSATDEFIFEGEIDLSAPSSIKATPVEPGPMPHTESLRLEDLFEEVPLSKHDGRGSIPTDFSLREFSDVEDSGERHELVAIGADNPETPVESSSFLARLWSFIRAGGGVNTETNFSPRTRINDKDL